MFRKQPAPPPPDPSKRVFDRTRLLNEELDRLVQDAAVRSGSIANKASFLAVAAGVIITAATSHLWAEAQWGGLGSLLAACAALLCAAIALRPGQRLSLVAQRLTDQYLYTHQSASEVEVQIVVGKSATLVAQERDLVARSRWVSLGFAVLIVASALLTITFAFETVWSTNA